ncbi:GNAT domain-containing protein [Dactylonectria macrodidyma]|uniref:GNAT domain-containing protein n=1 Tax=Dactylonectria macrodidyma TaxID=307937 RepID=A0A9P9F6B6_9HYPO|nr:GNAT domain-containing protein [Dactylonectria macrodidyma]
MEPSPIEWATVRTTLPIFPFPPNEQRQVIKTERLLLRPFNDSEDDLNGLHALRAQPEVMIWSMQGRPDKDLDETKPSIVRHIPPLDVDHYNWAICLASTGEIIGIGGNGTWKGELGWPVLGYMLRKEAWGKGYATEFLKAFVEAWWALPREEVELKVDKKTVRGDGEIKDEFITAVALDENAASHGVLRKAGFELATAWQEEDLRDTSKIATLYGFIAKDSRSGKAKQ